jgi:hypothetical protein
MGSRRHTSRSGTTPRRSTAKEKQPFFLVSWFRKLRARYFPTYEDLVAERDWYKESIWHWQYPDGTHVPPEQRRRLFGKIARLNRQIERHPDNPANRARSGRPADDTGKAAGSDE